MNMHDVLLQEKQDLQSQLSNAANSTDIKTINMKIGNVTGQINQVMQEFNEIQAENLKLYDIDSTLLKKYQTAADNFTSKIQTQYWNGKSTFEEKKDAFPLVSIGVNGKTKSVEITLWKGIENTTKADQYTTIINQLMPTDVPWFVDYGEYPISYTSVLVQNSSNATSLILSPHKQFQSGTLAQDVKCVQGFQIIVKSEDGSPACVKPNTIIPLTMRGWAIEPANHEMVYLMKSNSTAQIFVKFTARHWEGPGEPAQPISINPRFYTQGSSPQYSTNAINATVIPNSVYSGSDTIVIYTITSQDTPSGIYWLLIDDACSAIPIAVNLELPQIESVGLQSPTASLNCPSSAMPYQIVGVNGTTAEFVPY